MATVAAVPTSCPVVTGGRADTVYPIAMVDTNTTVEKSNSIRKTLSDDRNLRNKYNMFPIARTLCVHIVRHKGRHPTGQ